ncbi:enoyl-CoA hydratase/isomerase family protein [Rhodococcus sp. NPDC058521]|uniref:enoyl-CoA hydratase/isomerase family protein n=1 Tax=Rhodococcus sp. NPDC058521 TaxID=3346536 RepID=UPI00364FE8F6
MTDSVTLEGLSAGALDPVTPGDVLTFVELPEVGGVDRDVWASAVHHARRSRRILVGVGPTDTACPELLGALSLTLHTEGPDDRHAVRVESLGPAVDRMVESLHGSPLACFTCVEILRTSHELDVRSALVVESLGYSTLQAGPEYLRWLANASYPSKSDIGPFVKVERDRDTLVVELDRENCRNAIDARMRDALIEALDVAVLDEALTEVVITGRGESFSSGGDLTEFGTTPDPSTAHLVRTQYRPGEQIHRLAERLGDRCKVHVHGAVVGGGLELAAFAGRVVADPSARFRLPEISMGLIPGAGGTVSVTRRIGRWRAAWMMLTGEVVDATTALRWGLVDSIQTRLPAI